ncbi:hypothetical protein K438DRAFT_1780065 [Mycena galopus ATCC 62051]|nr:hypothetical protein K438DRAFT_1780065 [Mycena galopus ATCC 62051]
MATAPCKISAGIIKKFTVTVPRASVPLANFAKFRFPAAKVRQFNILVHMKHIAVSSLSSVHHVPSINHQVYSINYHIPSTYHYTVSARLMYSNNIWIEKNQIPAQKNLESGSVLTGPASIVPPGLQRSPSPKQNNQLIRPGNDSSLAKAPTVFVYWQPLKGWDVQSDGVAMSAAD